MRRAMNAGGQPAAAQDPRAEREPARAADREHRVRGQLGQPDLGARAPAHAPAEHGAEHEHVATRTSRAGAPRRTRASRAAAPAKRSRSEPRPGTSTISATTTSTIAPSISSERFSRDARELVGERLGLDLDRLQVLDGEARLSAHRETGLAARSIWPRRRHRIGGEAAHRARRGADDALERARERRLRSGSRAGQASCPTVTPPSRGRRRPGASATASRTASPTRSAARPAAAARAARAARRARAPPRAARRARRQSGAARRGSSPERHRRGGAYYLKRDARARPRRQATADGRGADGRADGRAGGHHPRATSTAPGSSRSPGSRSRRSACTATTTRPTCCARSRSRTCTAAARRCSG